MRERERERISSAGLKFRDLGSAQTEVTTNFQNLYTFFWVSVGPGLSAYIGPSLVNHWAEKVKVHGLSFRIKP